MAVSLPALDGWAFVRISLLADINHVHVFLIMQVCYIHVPVHVCMTLMQVQ